MIEARTCQCTRVCPTYRAQIACHDCGVKVVLGCIRHSVTSDFMCRWCDTASIDRIPLKFVPELPPVEYGGRVHTLDCEHFDIVETLEELGLPAELAEHEADLPDEFPPGKEI